jgi:cephalosporin hydroxylase
MILIDDGRVVVRDDSVADSGEYPLGSAEGFRILSSLWLRAGWDTKYVYSFSWLGRPVIQLPEDLIRVQEVIFGVKPDVIIETGVAHGGSLVFYATLCRAMRKGRVIGIDIDVRPHNRAAIEAHELRDVITLIDGSSVDPAVVERVRDSVSPGETAFVVLDSSHTKSHVLMELESYAPLVSPGSYIVAADGIMASLAGAPRSSPDWTWNNPKAAVADFIRNHREFVVDEPRFPFNEGRIDERVTYWPSAFLKRLPRD